MAVSNFFRLILNILVTLEFFRKKYEGIPLKNCCMYDELQIIISNIPVDGGYPSLFFSCPLSCWGTGMVMLEKLLVIFLMYTGDLVTVPVIQMVKGTTLSVHRTFSVHVRSSDLLF